jgi:hypothetical protein
MNSSLSFGHQEWDVIASPASTERAPKTEIEKTHDSRANILIDAQDLGTIRRAASQQDVELRVIVEDWMREQYRMAK